MTEFYEHKTVAISDLIPYVNNSRTHSDKQVKQIAASIKEFGFTNPVLIDEENGIIAGHGRVMAAEKLGLTEVPCIVLAGLSEAQKKAYVIADNQLALNAGWNEDLLKLELEGLKDEGFDLDLLGFSDKELDGFLQEMEDDDNPYTDKSDGLFYEPEGLEPELSELYSTLKSDSLIHEIENANIQDHEVEAFLMEAAKRHTVFNYKKIAEYYAEASITVQELMERSFLVIVDFDQAVENGFVKLSGKLKDQYEAENA